MKSKSKFCSIIGVLVILGTLLLGSLSINNQTALADDTKISAPYPTKIPPPPGEQPPDPASTGITYVLSSGRVSFQLYGYAENPYKSGSDVIGRSWHWAEYGGSPWDVDSMYTATSLWWWDSSEWISQDDAFANCSDTWRCE